MSVPTASIEEAVAEARRRQQANARWVADHMTPRTIAAGGQTA